MATEPIRVLLIEDDPDDAKLVGVFLAESRVSAIDLVHHDRLPAALAELSRGEFQVVLLDLNLLETTGLETFQQVHDCRPDVPVIMLTGLEVDEVALEAVKAGAEDYLFKNRLEPDLLIRAILYAVERARLRQAIQESELLFRSLVETTSDWIWAVDAEGALTYSSPKVQDFLGYEPCEVIGRTPFDLMLPEEAVRVRALLRPLVEARLPFAGVEHANLHKNRRQVVLETSGVPIVGPRGDYQGYRGIARDVTQRRLADEALRESEKRYRQLLGAVTSYTYTVRLQNGLPVATEHSPGSLTATGYTREDYERDPYLWITMVHPDDRDMVRTYVQRVLRQERVPPIEHRILRRDGALRWIRDTIVPHYDGDAMIRYDGLVEDITERRTAEERLLDSESEILAAQKIQDRLLPDRPPDLPGFDIAGAAFAAAFAGGDYYDFLPMRDGSLLLVIGDVSGHGLGAAMIMVLVYAHLRSLVQTEMDLGQIARQLNLLLANETDHFITMLMAKLDPAAGRLVYVNAGHPAGYVLDGGGRVKTRLESTTLPLGVLSDTPFPLGPPLCLESGDLLVLITDGVLESESSCRRYFGARRVEDVIRQSCDLPARQIIAALYRATRDFSGRDKPLDDIAVLVLKMLAAPG